MVVGNARGVLPVVDDAFDNPVHAYAMFDLREDKRSVTAHLPGIALHHGEVRADRSGEVCFINDQQVGLRYARPSFARDFVTSGDVNHINGVISKFAAEMSRQIVAAGFKKQIDLDDIPGEAPPAREDWRKCPRGWLRGDSRRFQRRGCARLPAPDGGSEIRRPPW